MKKVLFLFACLCVFSLTAEAQKKACAKKSTACSAKKMTKASAMGNAEVSVDDAVIAKAAALDESVERSVCAKSGKVSYYQKSVCPASGKVTKKAVKYDAATAKFVNVSPSDMAEGTAAKKACTPEEMKKCKKTCTAAEMKACAAKKAAKEAGLKGEAKSLKVSGTNE